MQRYLEQLIDDMRSSRCIINQPCEIFDETGSHGLNEIEMEDLAYVEEYLYGEERPISEITGIECKLLPAVEKLTEEQQALMAAELEDLLLHFNFYLDFPSGYPKHLRYHFIRNFWESKHVAMSFGESHIEFCSYEEENCPFPGYCTSCAEVAAQMKFDEETPGRNAGLGNCELPF